MSPIQATELRVNEAITVNGDNVYIVDTTPTVTRVANEGTGKVDTYLTPWLLDNAAIVEAPPDPPRSRVDIGSPPDPAWGVRFGVSDSQASSQDAERITALEDEIAKLKAENASRQQTS